MSNKPVIVYIERGYLINPDCEDNRFRGSLSYILRTVCDCEVVLYNTTSAFEADIANMIEIFSKNRMLCLIVCPDRYSNNEHIVAVDLVREHLSDSLPIIVLGDHYSELADVFTERPKDKHITRFSHEDIEIISYIKTIIRSRKTGLNWLGAETKEDRTWLLEKLWESHKFNESEYGLAGTSDRNDAIVMQALRLKLLPSACIKSEFDDVVKYEKPHRKNIPGGGGTICF